jgi:hypothetical protein
MSIYEEMKANPDCSLLSSQFADKVRACEGTESLVALALRLVEVIRLKNLYIDQLEYEVAEAPNHSDI